MTLSKLIVLIRPTRGALFSLTENMGGPNYVLRSRTTQIKPYFGQESRELFNEAEHIKKSNRLGRLLEKNPTKQISKRNISIDNN